MERGFATGAKRRADALFPGGSTPEKSAEIYRRMLLIMADFNVYRACEKLEDEEQPQDGKQWVEPKTENLNDAIEYLEGALFLLELYNTRTMWEREKSAVPSP